MNDEFFIKLRDCFTTGYTLPQYCIDNGIKHPLFVSEKKWELFVWEIYVQFCYDKRLTAQFSFIDKPAFKMNHSVSNTVWVLRTKDFSKELFADYDKVIFLLTDNSKVQRSDKTIYLGALLDYFVRKTYYEIPLLNYLQRYPTVKLILTKLPSITQYKGGREFNKTLPRYEDLIPSLRSEDGGTLETSLDHLGYTKQEQLLISMYTKVEKNSDGTTTLIDDFF